MRPDKIAVAGIPNFDNLIENLHNPFPFHGHVLVATSPNREALRFEDRPAFLRHCVRIAGGRPLIIKLHPLENAERARREIASIVPGAMVLTHGNVNHMIAKAEAVITQKSTCTYVALALQKEIYTQLDLDELHRLMPLQNNCDSSRRVASLCRQILHTPMPVLESRRLALRNRPKSQDWARRLLKGG